MTDFNDAAQQLANVPAIRDLIEAAAAPGAAILDEVHAFLGRFVAYPDTAAQIAHALWLAHTHAMDAWDSTPRLAFLSPESGSGKTRALEISELLVPRPVAAINVTPAYLFRKVGDRAGRPTILYDEIDTVFGPKARDNEEIRGLLNAGHRRGAKTGRAAVKGRTVTTEEIEAYCAVALAGLGDLPDTILNRSVVIRMRRRAPHEHVEPYRRRVNAVEGEALRDRLADWMASITDDLVTAWPALPYRIRDRDADIWEPLLAVADAAGAEWPERARAAAVTQVTQSGEDRGSLGIRLLSDTRTAFDTADVMLTKKLLAALHAMPESPWLDLGGKGLNDRGLAKRLGQYGVRSTTIRSDGAIGKGYRRQDLHDPWTRYLADTDVT